MCLSNVDVKLMWDKQEKAFIGHGYKLITNDNLSTKYNPVGKWTRASGNRYDKTSKLVEKIEYSDTGESYTPGFHIFLNLRDAENYSTIGTVYKVIYKKILAFGKNETRTDKNGFLDADGPCVVAEYLKIVAKVA